MNKSRILTIVLACVAVAALIFGFVSNGQKGDLQKQVESLNSNVKKLTDDLNTEKQNAQEAAKQAEEALTAAKEAADQAVAAAKEEAQKTMEETVAATKEEAEKALEQALAAAKEEAEKALEAAVAAAKEETKAAQAPAQTEPAPETTAEPAPAAETPAPEAAAPAASAAEAPAAETAEQAAPAPAPAETAPQTAAEVQNPVLATIGGKPVYKSECDDIISRSAQQGTAVTYAQAMEQLKFNRVLEMVMEEDGYLNFTEEEVAKIRDEIQAAWDGYLDQYVSYYLSEDTEEARADLRKQAEESLYAGGLSVDSLVESQKLNEGYERLTNALVPEEAVTEDKVQAYYDQLVEQQKSMVGDSAYMRELYGMYYGNLFYMPSGYRNVTHILIKVDEALLKAYQEASNNYNALQQRYEEQKKAAEAPVETAAPAQAEATEAPAETAAPAQAEATEAPAETAVPVQAEGTEAPAAQAEAQPTEAPQEPVTEAQLEEARLAMEAAKAAVLESKKDVLDDIEARLAAGEPFETLIAQYNEDPGLDPAVGYEVHRESIKWDPVFRDAAFSEEMVKPGDHSKPVVGSYGIHILYYLSDAQEGALPMTAEVRAQIVETLRNEMINEAAYNIYQEKLPTVEVTVDSEAIAALDSKGSDVSIDFQAE